MGSGVIAGTSRAGAVTTSESAPGLARVAAGSGSGDRLSVGATVHPHVEHESSAPAQQAQRGGWIDGGAHTPRHGMTPPKTACVSIVMARMTRSMTGSDIGSAAPE